MRKLLIILLLLISITAHAAEVILIPEISETQGFFTKIVSKIKNCTWHLTCYFEKSTGATITTINATDLIRNSRATINTNFANLNSDKTEVSSSSIAAITTLSNLVTVGTLTSGSLGSGFTTVVVARGGTGSTTLSSNQVLLGNGTGGLSVPAGLGSSGQFLTSNGAGSAPSWTTGSVDQAINYTWTGQHMFTASTSLINATTTNATSTSFFATFASSTRMIIGSLGVGVSTTTSSSTEIGGDLYVRGAISAGTSSIATAGYEIVNTQTSGQTTAGNAANLAANCPAGKLAVGGGGTTDETGGEVYIGDSYPVDNNTWQTDFWCYAGSGGCAAHTVTTYVICIR